MSPPAGDPGRRIATLDDFEVGQRASFSKTITEVDLALFIALTGDVNPLHVDDRFARGTFFGSRIAHGMLTGSLLSTVIGTALPGAGAIYRSQTLEFLRPVRVGDTLTAWAEVASIDRDGNRMELRTWIVNGGGERVLDGRAVVSLLRDRRP